MRATSIRRWDAIQARARVRIGPGASLFLPTTLDWWSQLTGVRPPFGAVVDTIINRAMSGIKNWSTFRGVINDRWQFSDINARRAGAYGCVQNVPESRVPARVMAMVIAHLQDRANGGPSLVGNNLSYANPYVLDEATDATRAWSEDVVRQASITGYSYGKGRATHVHGTIQGLIPF
nr:cell wall hydrolase [Burkholderia ambifaria]